MFVRRAQRSITEKKRPQYRSEHGVFAATTPPTSRVDSGKAVMTIETIRKCRDMPWMKPPHPALDLFFLFDEATWLDSHERECLSRLRGSLIAPSSKWRCAVGFERTVSLLLGSGGLDFAKANAALRAGLVSDDGSIGLCREIRRFALFEGQKEFFLDLCRVLGEENIANVVATELLVDLTRTMKCCRACHAIVLETLVFGRGIHECVHQLSDYRKLRASVSPFKELMGGNVAAISVLVSRRSFPLHGLIGIAEKRRHPDRNNLFKPLLDELSHRHLEKFWFYRQFLSRELGIQETRVLSTFYISLVVDIDAIPWDDNGVVDPDAVTSLVSSLLVLASGRVFQ